MAKRKRATRKQADVEPEAPSPENKSRDFIGTLRDTFKSAGQTAERYARMGINIAELEALRLKLKGAYAALGENVIKCWDAAPDLGVAAADSAVKEQVKAIADLRRRIREIEIKLRNLKQAS
jgi:predicted DNA-binding protein (UPF0251 family)